MRLLLYTVLLYAVACYVIEGPGPHHLADVSFTDPNGPCITIRNAHNVHIERISVGPCKGNGITVSNSVGVHIGNSTFQNVATGVYALKSSSITVEHNDFTNMLGPFPRGQCVQTDKCQGPIDIVWNHCVNEPNRSNPEDIINLFQSTGTAAQPIVVAHNLVEGGGPSTTGCGILVGDHFGTHQYIRDNILIDPGQCGIGVAAGTHIVVADNIIVSDAHPWSNVGLYVWEQYGADCHTITLDSNRVRWVSRQDKHNHYWNGGNCQALTWVDNKWGDSISKRDARALLNKAGVVATIEPPQKPDKELVCLCQCH